VACSLTDVLSLLPTPTDPFVVGPRDYLTQFLTLLSTLRNGDNRFLPLLLQKVHDVLPRLASPMLQVVPEPSPQSRGGGGMDPNVDIFDGFGNAGMGTASNLPVSFDSKRIEDLPSERSVSSESNSPYPSPSLMQTGMDFPGLGEYPGYSDISTSVSPQGSNLSRQKSLNGQRSLPRAPPLRQNSQSSAFNVIPRSAPEYQQMMQNSSGELEHMVGIGEASMRRLQQNGLQQSCGMEQQQRQIQSNVGHVMNMGVDGINMSYR